MAVGGTQSNGIETVHLSHPLIAAAVAEARDAGTDFRVRFDLGPNAPPTLRERRGRRGRLALTRIAHHGFEREDRLRVTAVFEDAEVLRPAEAALDLIRQPCMDVPPFDPPLKVTAEDLEEVVDEELFFDCHELANADESDFRDTMDQLDRYLADRTLVLRRAHARQQQRLVAAENARDRAMGAEQRGRADTQVRAAESRTRAHRRADRRARGPERRHLRTRAPAGTPPPVRRTHGRTPARRGVRDRVTDRAPAQETDVALTLLHTADWHLGRRFPAFERDQEQQLTRARLDAVGRILDLAESRNVDAVLCAGDLFDDPFARRSRGGAAYSASSRAAPGPGR